MFHHLLQGRNYVHRVPLKLQCLPANMHGVTFQKKPLDPKAFTAPDSKLSWASKYVRRMNSKYITF